MFERSELKSSLEIKTNNSHVFSFDNSSLLILINRCFHGGRLEFRFCWIEILNPFCHAKKKKLKFCFHCVGLFVLDYNLNFIRSDECSQRNKLILF